MKAARIAEEEAKLVAKKVAAVPKPKLPKIVDFDTFESKMQEKVSASARSETSNVSFLLCSNAVCC